MQDFRKLLHYEVSVNLALLDGLRPGDACFDIGANVGTQAAIMSRMVGPRGLVTAVEANPKTAVSAREALMRLGCANAQVLNRAVTERTGDTIKLFLGDGPNDSIIPHPWISSASVDVETITLDDLSQFLGVDPALVKVDIEGAEIQALNGAQALIGRSRPTFILEQNAQADDCVQFLRERGYACLDLNSYLPIERATDYPHYAQNPVRNIVCYPTLEAGASKRSVYDGVVREEVARLGEADFAPGLGGQTSGPLKLAGGRYTVSFDYACADDLELQIGVWDASAGDFVEFYESAAGWLRYACFDLPFHLDADTEAHVVMRPKAEGGDLVVREAVIARAAGLPARRPGRVFML